MARKKKESSVQIPVFKESRPYVLWRRVSTRRQGKSGLGLEAQLVYAQRYMGREPIEIYTDVKSGSNLMACQGLWEAIALCKEKDYVLVVAKTDRFRCVEDACAVLKEIGEGNIIFCDLPESNKFVLQIMWAVWERHLDMMTINTTRGLEMRKMQAERDGGWFSRSGQWRTKLGNPKGCDTTAAVQAHAIASAEEARIWRENNVGFQWVCVQVSKGVPQVDILKEFNYYYDKGISGFCTRTGKRMTKGVMSYWCKEARRKLMI